MSLSAAILQLQERIAAFGQGTQKQPKEGTTEWFLLRADSAGLAFLQRMETLKIERNSAAADALYKSAKHHFKQGPAA